MSAYLHVVSVQTLLCRRFRRPLRLERIALVAEVSLVIAIRANVRHHSFTPSSGGAGTNLTDLWLIKRHCLSLGQFHPLDPDCRLSPMFITSSKHIDAYSSPLATHCLIVVLPISSISAHSEMQCETPLTHKL